MRQPAWETQAGDVETRIANHAAVSLGCNMPVILDG